MARQNYPRGYGTPYGYGPPYGGYGMPYGPPSPSPGGYGMPMPYGAPFPPAGGYGMPFPPVGAFGPPMTPEWELQMLKGQAEYFEDLLDGIKQRIEELEKEAGQK